MRDPFLCDGPTNIAFSGGRTSGLMLRRTLDAHGGTLPADCRAIFSNTGREREETLEFVRDCGEQWGVDIVWVERRRVPGEPATAVRVTFDTASRNGEPFDALIDERSYLPNPVTRFCTEELKIKTTKRYLMSLGYEHWTSCVGLRFDEPKRVARIHASKRERERRWRRRFTTRESPSPTWRRSGKRSPSTCGCSRMRATATYAFSRASRSGFASSKSAPTSPRGGWARNVAPIRRSAPTSRHISAFSIGRRISGGFRCLMT